MNTMYKYSFLIGYSYGFCNSNAGTGWQVFDCTFSNQVVLMKCSVDGGVPEICSMPFEVTVFTYGLDPHILEVTAYDVFGLNMTLTQHFQLDDRECFVDCHMSQ